SSSITRRSSGSPCATCDIAAEAYSPGSVVGFEACRERLHDLRLDRRDVAQQPPEVALGDHEEPRRLEGRDGRRPLPARDQRDLAEEVAVAEQVDLPAAAAH